jgi:electron transfer flavoprotein beta subunit
LRIDGLPIDGFAFGSWLQVRFFISQSAIIIPSIANPQSPIQSSICNLQSPMKIAVCIKQVVTREWQLRVNDAKSWIRDQDASFELNEPDAYALEEALRLKEKHGGEVIVCSAGPARATQVIREALARGADRALHVESDALASADAAAVATALAAAIKDEQVDLVLTGLQSDDQGFGQVGVLLAAALGMPHATIIMEVQADSGQLRVKRELEGGWFQWMSLPLPALLTIQSGINQLRYATLKGIMAAKKKEIKKVTPQAAPVPTQRITSIYFPEKAKQTQMISGSAADAAKALIGKLRDEARVLPS